MTAPATQPPPAPVPPTKEQFLQWVKELEGCNWVLNDPVLPGEGKRATERAIELEQLIEAAPFEFDGDGNLIDTRAPLPAEPSGEDGPWAEGWNERSASESSGDVHLRQALEEIERLKGELKDCAHVIQTVANLTHVRAFDPEALSAGIIKLVTDLESALAAALARAETAEKLLTFIRDECDWEEPFGDKRIGPAIDAYFATPSPAPVAGKTNPPEISSPLVDGGEKASAGPTPRTDSAVVTRSVVINNNLCDVDCVEPDFARTLERELTASESLLSYAENCLHWGTSFADYERQKELLLTPPVAGGEG